MSIISSFEQLYYYISVEIHSQLLTSMKISPLEWFRVTIMAITTLSNGPDFYVELSSNWIAHQKLFCVEYLPLFYFLTSLQFTNSMLLPFSCNQGKKVANVKWVLVWKDFWWSWVWKADYKVYKKKCLHTFSWLSVNWDTFLQCNVKNCIRPFFLMSRYLDLSSFKYTKNMTLFNSESTATHSHKNPWRLSGVHISQCA